MKNIFKFLIISLSFLIVNFETVQAATNTGNADVYKVAKARIEEVINLTGLTPEANKKIGQLSKGYRQRGGLAAALLHDPEVLILDEPTTGLSFSDVAKLISVLQQLRDKGHTMVIIEHHLDVVKSCDWVIDLGPEGGERGGQVIATGTPEDVAAVSDSPTGQFLASMLNR